MGLKEKNELPVLAYLVSLHYQHRDYDEETLNNLLFSDETQEAIRLSLGLDKRVYSRVINVLKRRNLIIDDKLYHKLTSYPKDGDFKLLIDFKIVTEGETNIGTDGNDGKPGDSNASTVEPRPEVSHTEDE